MKNLWCRVGLHKWQIIKSTKASHIILLLKRKNYLLKNTNFTLEKDYIIHDRLCQRCKSIDNEIEETTKYFKEKLMDQLVPRREK